MTFNEEEKIRLFNKIEEHYFRRNFGSMSKTDLETLLFSEYIESCINNNKPYDDYSLSKELGVTQARIRSLKERKELTEDKLRLCNEKQKETIKYPVYRKQSHLL